MDANQTTQTSLHSFRRYYKPLEPILNKPQNRVYTATILSFLVVSLFMWYAVRPTMQTIFALRREIKDNLEISKQMEEKISALVQAQATYQSISQDIPLINEALPRNPEPVLLLISLRNLATQVDATISGIQLQDVALNGTVEKKADSTTPAADALPNQDANIPTTEPNSTEVSAPVVREPQNISMTITVEGPYGSIRQFLDGLANMRRITSIQDIIIIPVSGSGSETDLVNPTLKATIKLNAFYLPGGNI